MTLEKWYENKKVVVIGGLGFMGRNLLTRLVELGARITVVNREITVLEKGGLAKLGGSVVSAEADILDLRAVAPLVDGQDVLFSLAGHSGALGSLERPYVDLDINCRGALNVLEACRERNPGIKIVFPGSRLVYGRIRTLPVKESHPVEPITLYGVHKFAAERYHLIYDEMYGLRSVVLRISNPFGPHPRNVTSEYNIVNRTITQALKGEAITVFGDGSQLRDYLYIEDLVDLFLLLGADEAIHGEVFNVGGPNPVTFADMVKTIVATVGRGEVLHIPWPQDYAKVETGDYLSDSSKVTATTGWQAKTDLEAGVRKTVETLADNGSLLARVMKI